MEEAADTALVDTVLEEEAEKAVAVAEVSVEEDSEVVVLEEVLNVRQGQSQFQTVPVRLTVLIHMVPVVAAVLRIQVVLEVEALEAEALEVEGLEAEAAEEVSK